MVSAVRQRPSGPAPPPMWWIIGACRCWIRAPTHAPILRPESSLVGLPSESYHIQIVSMPFSIVSGGKALQHKVSSIGTK